MQYPIGEEDKLKGVVDLLEIEEIIFSGKYGEYYEKREISKKSELHYRMNKERNKIIEEVGNYDDEIAEMYLN